MRKLPIPETFFFLKVVNMKREKMFEKKIRQSKRFYKRKMYEQKKSEVKKIPETFLKILIGKN